MTNVKHVFLILFFFLIYNKGKSQFAIAGIPGSSYFDIVPDTTLNVDFYNPVFYYIDLNQDNINDIKIQFETFTAASSYKEAIQALAIDTTFKICYLKTDSAYSSSPFCPTSTGYAYASILKPFNINDTIKNETYVTSSYLSFSSSCGLSCNEWITGNDQFIGIKYTGSSTPTYGWIRLAVTNSHKITIKDFSFGKETIGINRLSNNTKINIYPNPASNKLFISTQTEAEIQLFDLLGKQIISTKNNVIDTENLSEGIYFVSVKTTKDFFIKKIIVQH
ncbi:MAG: T9SS type A sorting domain-containing protein [Bacteroidia bacterium]